MTIEKMKLKTVPFDVHIPNLDGDGIAETVRIQVQARADPETGEDVLTPESLEAIEKTQARHMGLMLAPDIKGLRTQLGLSQDEMSDLVQIGAKTYTRWESGRARPSRSMNVMLCALRDGQLSLNYLRALRNPHLQPAWNEANMRRSILTFICDKSDAAQAEFKFHFSSAARPGTRAALYWKCLRDFDRAHPENDPSPSCSGILEAIREVWTQDEITTPKAPRLPSAREQRKAFMEPRFDPFPPEETVSG